MNLNKEYRQDVFLLFGFDAICELHMCLFVTERGECLPLRIDDDFLIRFLRARNFQLKRAHRLVSCERLII